MMDTILNLGLGDRRGGGPRARDAGNERFAWDSYRRFVQMFGEVVLGVPADRFEHALSRKKSARGVAARHRARRAGDLRELVDEFRRLVRERDGRGLPGRPARAAAGRDRRRVPLVAEPTRRRSTGAPHGIPDDLGTAVNVDAMVFGNLGDDSRHRRLLHPQPGDRRAALYGEFLPNAQGEDVVAGIRTPLPLGGAGGRSSPDAYARAARDHGAARGALRRRAGHRVHDRARHAVHAADPRRPSAPRRPRCGSPSRPGRRGRDRPRPGASAASTRRSSTSCCTPRSTRAPSASGVGARAARVAGRRERRGRLRRRRPPSARHAAASRVILVRCETSPEDIHGMIVAAAAS